MKSHKDYLRLWQLDELALLAETRSSNVYLVRDRAGNKLVFKHLKPAGQEESIGAHLLKWYAKDGAVEIMQYDNEAQLLEYVDGATLKTVVERGDDAKATEIITEVVQKLFKTRIAPPPSELIPLATRFRDLFRKAEQDQKEGHDSLFIRAASAVEKLLATQTNVKPLHGDLHHENILESERGWLAIDPKGLIGDACYEFGNIFRNPDITPPIIYDGRRIRALAKTFSDRFDLDMQRMLEFGAAHACLSAAWDFFDGQDPSIRLEVARLIYSVME